MKKWEIERNDKIISEMEQKMFKHPCPLDQYLGCPGYCYPSCKNFQKGSWEKKFVSDDIEFTETIFHAPRCKIIAMFAGLEEVKEESRPYDTGPM